MKKVFGTIGLVSLIAVLFVSTIGATVLADGKGYGSAAPNSGDCIPDGSGFDGEVGGGVGPAPNAGDGIPDGSGF